VDLKKKSVAVSLESVKVKRGTTIDFVVDGREDEKATSTPGSEDQGRERRRDWEGERDFHGPLAALSAKERLAQVLLETNEFTFED